MTLRAPGFEAADLTHVVSEKVAVQEFTEWTRKSALIVALCFVLNMVDGIDVLVVSYIAPALQKAWAVSPAQFSIAFSAGLAGMALGGIGLAPLADRFGRRRLVVTALTVMTVSMLASSTANTVAELSIFRFFVGSGIGTVLACIAAVAARVAPTRHRNFAVGVLQAGYPIGAMLSGFATAWALPRYGWQSVVLATAAVSVLCIPLVMLILPASIQPAGGSANVRIAEVIASERRRASILLWISTICGFMALYFITSWITKLAIVAGLPESQAIVASAIYNFGAFFGTLAMSIAGTKLDIRKLSSGLLVLTSGVFLLFGGLSLPLAGVLVAAFAMGVALQGGFNALYPIAARVYPDNVRATGIGWAMGIGRIGAFTGPLLGGWALGKDLPLVGVFGIFCVPLLIAAVAVRGIRFAD